MANKRAPVYCSFCGKSQDQARRLIGGPNGVFICDECVALCNRILADERNARTPPPDDAPQGSRHP